MSKTDVSSVVGCGGHVVVAFETFGNHRLSLHSEETKKARFLEFLVEKLSKSNDVRAQDQTFLAVLLPLKIRDTEGGDKPLLING
jgi:hypothetical protein